MASGQEANDDNLGKSFRSSTQYWYVSVLIRIACDEAILMSTRNIHNHDKISKFP